MAIALVHIHQETGRVLGVWLSEQQCAYLRTAGGLAARTLGFEIMRDKKSAVLWSEWAEFLAETWPTAARWQAIDCRDSEDARHVLARVVAMEAVERRDGKLKFRLGSNSVSANTDIVPATAVHVDAHTRKTRRGVTNVEEYTYERGSGGRSTSGTVAAPESDSASRAGMRRITEADHKRLASDGIKVPPGWKNVQVAEDPEAPLQVIGVDSKGRGQYVYSSAHTSRQSQAKFARIQALRSAIPHIDQKLSEDAGKSDHAGALALIRRLGLRPGSESETGAEKKAFGATNLRVEHVSVSDGVVSLNFTGKKGVDLSFEVEDPELAAILGPRLKGKKPTDRVFVTSGQSAAAYLQTIAPGFKVKDLRTYYGSMFAFSIVREMLVPTTTQDAVKARRAVAKQVAAKLGNTPVVALESYIDPAVFAPWEFVVKGSS